MGVLRVVGTGQFRFGGEGEEVIDGIRKRGGDKRG